VPHDVLAAARSGDVLALARLLDLLTPYVTRLCGPIALQDTPDAVQESLIRIFQGIGQLQNPDALYGWVRTMSVREAVRVARKAKREMPWDELSLESTTDPELATDIRDVLDRLTPEHRAVLVLREVDGLDERSAGLILDIPAGTVKSRLYRARESFRKAWTR
jgi:RNA polymerase sigma-70 factor (ECF subfamily)